MPTQDTSAIKEKIISFLKTNGPGLPVQIARQIDMSPLFASAFLSELLAEKKLKISSMKVGSSPLYFLPGQENLLANFSQYLKSREKDAYEILKNKKFLKDAEQEPAIRVALRAIRDFAIPFRRKEEIHWRYFIIPESEFPYEKEEPRKENPPEEIVEDSKEEDENPSEEKPKKLEIFDNTKKELPKKNPTKKKKSKKSSSNGNEKFFNQVKEFLNEKNFELLDIESFSKDEISLRIRAREKEHLLLAYKKKRICEEDLIKANKKASEMNLPYIVACSGEPLKKVSEFVDAAKNLSTIEKINP